MNVAVISTTVLPVPPSGYSGLEQLAYQLAGGLAGRGHRVLLVAPKGSTPPPGVELHGTTLREPERQAYSGYWQRLPAFDAVVDESWEKWAYILKFEGRLKAPVLGVMHAPIHTMYRRAPPVPKPCIVCISKDQAVAAQTTWKTDVRVAYNGIDLGFYRAADSVQRTDRYLFLARMSRVKGPHLAIDAAQQAGVPLDLVGDESITNEPDYAETLKLRCAASQGQIVYHGGIPRQETVKFYAQAKALLHMNEVFREPFGLAPCEAMACGCPVIAWDNGAMRETIRVGETGFLVRSLAEVVDLIKSRALDRMSAAACREWIAQFSVDRMVDRYIELIQEALTTGGW